MPGRHRPGTQLSATMGVSVFIFTLSTRQGPRPTGRGKPRIGVTRNGIRQSGALDLARGRPGVPIICSTYHFSRQPVIHLTE